MFKRLKDVKKCDTLKIPNQKHIMMTLREKAVTLKSARLSLKQRNVFVEKMAQQRKFQNVQKDEVEQLKRNKEDLFQIPIQFNIQQIYDFSKP